MEKTAEFSLDVRTTVD